MVHDSSKFPLWQRDRIPENQKAYLLNYLLNGRLDNRSNRAERSSKPFVIDRKNSFFTNTPGGTQGSVVIFSLIHTAIENELDLWRYLTWLIDTTATGNTDADNMFPWVAPDSCKVSI